MVLGPDSVTEDCSDDEREAHEKSPEKDYVDVELQLPSSTSSDCYRSGDLDRAERKNTDGFEISIRSTSGWKHEKKGDLVLSASMVQRSMEEEEDEDEEKDEDSIACTTANHQETQATCAICIARYHVGDKICWSPNPSCEHVFHHECIRMWLEKHDDCPMCRAPYFLSSDTSTSGPSPENEIRPGEAPE